MTQRLAAVRCLVTGAGSGIGRATAGRFAAEGALVALVDRDAAAVAEAATEIRAAGGHALGLTADVADEPGMTAAVEDLLAAHGGLDVAVVNAGIQLFGEDARATDLDLDVWERTLRVNLTGAFVTARCALRAMLATGGGSLIFTGSPTGLFGGARGFTAYSASKAGVHGLMRVLAADYAEHGIRVNAVVPGFTRTPLVDVLHEDPAAREALLATVPLGRAGTPEEVASMMVFLASDESRYATGAFFTVDGGMTAV